MEAATEMIICAWPEFPAGRGCRARAAPFYAYRTAPVLYRLAARILDKISSSLTALLDRLPKRPPLYLNIKPPRKARERLRSRGNDKGGG